MPIPLAEWARRRGVSYPTANRWYHRGRLPVRAEQSPRGRREIVVFPDEPSPDCRCVDDQHVACAVRKLRALGYQVTPPAAARPPDHEPG